MAQDKKIDIQATIKEAVNAGLQAGRVQASKAAGDAHKATERRLYAYPVLVKKIQDDKEHMQELLQNGAPEKSTSFVRFTRSGMRLSPDEILEALVADLTATIAADEHEVAEVKAALQTIEADAYCLVMQGKYIEGLPDEEIAAQIPCDTSTVRRHRGRMLRSLAVRLYGSQAI